jgi:hypothetical protein
VNIQLTDPEKTLNGAAKYSVISDDEQSDSQSQYAWYAHGRRHCGQFGWHFDCYNGLELQ